MKNYILLFILSLAFYKVSAQKRFQINGTLTGQGINKLRLSYLDNLGKFVLDSTEVKDGQFMFSGNVSEPTMASLSVNRNVSVDDPNFTTIFISPNLLEVKLTVDKFKERQLIGSATDLEFQALEKSKEHIGVASKPVLEKMREVGLRYMAAARAKKPEAELQKLREESNEASKLMTPFIMQREVIDMKFIKSHPNSYLSPNLLFFKISGMKLEDVMAIYRGFSPEIQQSRDGQRILVEIKKLQAGSPGSMAKVFSKPDINGKQISLADYKGNSYVLLDFWASWCVPCRKGNPHLISLYNKYKSKGFEIIGVSDDDATQDAWKKAVEVDKIGIWRHILRGLKKTPDGFDRSEDISGEGYGIHTLPTKILIDKEGKIIGRYGGGGGTDEDLDKKLSEIFEPKS